MSHHRRVGGGDDVGRDLFELYRTTTSSMRKVVGKVELVLPGAWVASGALNTESGAVATALNLHYEQESIKTNSAATERW